jgi:hypothetical protein
MATNHCIRNKLLTDRVEINDQKKGPVEMDQNRQRPNLNDVVNKKASGKQGTQYTAELALSSGDVVRMES